MVEGIELKKLYKEREVFIEKYRLSSRPKMYKLNNQAIIDLWNLTEKLIREHKKEYINRVRELGLLNAIDDLTPREQKVLKMRFLEFKNLEEVGNEFGVTRECIRQLEFKAFEKLRTRPRML